MSADKAEMMKNESPQTQRMLRSHARHFLSSRKEDELKRRLDSYMAKIDSMNDQLLADEYRKCFGNEVVCCQPQGDKHETNHKQVRIQWEDMEADVDEGIAPLILALWKNGISTSLSCQENKPGIAWILFPIEGDAFEFLNLVAKFPSDDGQTESWNTLYGRIGCYGDVGEWQYECFPVNLSVEEFLVGDVYHDKCTGPSDFYFSISIRFPVTDIPLLVEIASAELSE